MDPKTDIGQLGTGRIRSPAPAKDGGRKIGNRPPFHKIMLETLAATAPANLRHKIEIEKKSRDREEPDKPPSVGAAGYAPLTALLVTPAVGDAVKAAPPLNPEIPRGSAQDQQRAVRQEGAVRDIGRADMSPAIYRKPTEAKAEAPNPDHIEPSVKATIAPLRDDQAPTIKNDVTDESHHPLPSEKPPETITNQSRRDSNASALAPTKPSVQVPEADLNMTRELVDEVQLPAAAMDRPVKKTMLVEVNHASKNDRPAATAEERTGKSKQQAGNEPKDGREYSQQMPTTKMDVVERSQPPSAVTLDTGSGPSPGRQLANIVTDMVSLPQLPGTLERPKYSRDGQLKTLELVLHPETIGRVRVSLHLRGKALELRIEAKSANAAGAIEQDRSLLRQLLSEAGFQLSVADIKVEVQAQAREIPTHEQGGFQPGGKAGEGGRGESSRPRDSQAAWSGSETRSNSGDNAVSADRAGGTRGGIYI